MTTDAWLRVFRREYLAGFLAAGGSCVKIVIADAAPLRKELTGAVAAAATAQGFRFVHLDSVTTKLHLIDKLFYGVASRVEWRQEVASFLAAELRTCGYHVEPKDSILDAGVIAAANGRTEAALMETLQSILKREIVADLAMSIEFRYAMLHLCMARIHRNGQPQSDLEPHILAWLSGDLSSISTLRKASIFQRIGRHNGRHLLYSLTAWLRKCGAKGMILAIDISRYLATVKTADRREGFYYTPANTGDLYEILRECIDDVDQAAGIAVLVLSTGAVLCDERRGLDAYQALKMRVFDDVRVRGHQNPVGPLIRLGPREGNNGSGG